MFQRHWHAGLSSLLCLFFIAIAVGEGRQAVEGVTSPYDIDHFRDVASAQSILDGEFPNDPAYCGELIWYNPLMPAAVALASRITGLEVATAYVQAGPYLNALGLVAFFVMMILLFGPWPAVIATTSLIFAPPYGEINWATPTYSPWLFAANFAPLFFYIGLMLCWKASQHQSARAWIVAGAGLGVAFMAHTAPALILGVCALIAALTMHRSPPTGHGKAIRAPSAIFLLITTALLVSIPLLRSIVWHYHLRILNPAPNNWYWDAIDLKHLRPLLASSINFKNALAVLGGVFVIGNLRSSLPARLVFAWFITALGLFAYNLLQQRLAFNGLPPLLPNYHSYVYLQGAGHVLVGLGTWNLVSRIVAIVRRKLSPNSEESIGLLVSSGITAALAVAFVATALPRYKKRADSVGVRAAALNMSAQQRTSRISEKVRLATPQGAVIVASPENSIYNIVPAGRQVIVLPREFSNPYVDYAARAAAQSAMFAAFLAQDTRKFRELASNYSVTHILLGPNETATFDAIQPQQIATRELFRHEGVVLLSYLGTANP